MDPVVETPEVTESEPAAEAAPEVPSTFKVGENEYSSEDVQSMADLKQKVSEIEKNHGSLDNLTSVYGKQANEVGELRKKLQEVETSNDKAERERKQESGEQLTPEEQLRNYVEYSRNAGFVHKDNIQTIINQQLEARDLVNDVKRMQDEVNGEDGKPAFKAEEILKYMQTTGFKDPMKAYKDLHEEAIDKWKEEQLLKNRRPGIETNTESKAGSTREPKEVKPTKDNLNDLVSEALNI